MIFTVEQEWKTTTWISSNNSKDPHRGARVEDNDVDVIEQLQKEPHRGTREEDNDVDVIELLQQPSPWNRSGRQQISEAIKIKCTEYETVILLLTEK